MKKERWSRKRIVAWIMAFAMVCSLVTVPGKAVEAATDIDLSVKSGSSATSATIAKNEYGDDYIADVFFDIPQEAASKSAITSNSIKSMEVKLTVTSFTAGTETPCVMLYAQPGEDGGWNWNQSTDVDLVKNTQLTLTYNFSSMNWNSGSTMGNLGIRFANCANGSTVQYTIDSAKLIKEGTAGGTTEGTGDSTGSQSDEVEATISKLSGNADWAEYNYSVTNGLDTAISGIKIKIPVTGTANSLQAWNCSATSSNGYIIVSHSAVLQPGQTYNCSSDTKFGFAGGATLGTPIVEFVYGEDGGGTSSSALKYELTGEKKTTAFSDTPLGKHGKLSLKQVDGYSAPIIVDANEKPFQLRGASTHGMQWDAMHPYVNKDSFQSLRDEWGVNMVRLVSYVTQGGYTEGSQALLDSKIQEGVKAATELGMYVIIDWHIHAENPLTKQSNAETFFQKYATMYKDYDNVIFEICNEPTGVVWYNGSGSDLYSYCKAISTVIRNCGSDALIVCGTNTWSQDVDDVAQKPLKNDGFENILYTFHFYSASHYADKMTKVRTAIAAGTPIFVTEFGICSADGNGTYDTANADAWIKLCDDNNISYACWSLCNKSEAASYLKTSATKTTGGWVESDLAPTGIWLVNTYRAHEEIENESASGSDTPISVTGVSLNKTTLTLGKGTTDSSLLATVKPSTASNKKVNWTSDKESVATVDTTGKVTAVAAGSATITATTEDGSFKATCTVNVSVPIQSISLNKETITLENGTNETLTTTIAPTDATGVTKVWTSSKETVATVDQTGKVTAVGNGTATITVEAGGQTDTCTVTVKTSVTGVTLNKTELVLAKGGFETLVPTVAPTTASNKKVNWTSDKESVATVDTNGKVTAVAAGTAIITATTEDGSFKATCTVTVSKKTQVAPVISEINTASRTKDSLKIEVKPAATDGKSYEYSIDAGTTWQTSAEFTGLNPNTEYTVSVRLAGDNNTEPSETATKTESLGTLVNNPYSIDISKLSNSVYVNGLYETDNATDTTQTASYDSETITLLQSNKNYIITGVNADVKIVLAAGVTGTTVTLQNTTCESVTADSVTIKDGTIVKGNITATTVNINGSATISGNITANTVTISAGATDNITVSGNISATEDVVIEGGIVEVDKGITATENITIEVEEIPGKNSNTTVTVTGDTGKAGLEAGGTITISDGTVNATGGTNAEGILGNIVDITGGTVVATGTGTGTGISGTTSVNLTGGTVTATAGQDKTPATSIDTGTNGIIKWDGASITDATDDMFSKTPVDESGNLVMTCTITYVVASGLIAPASQTVTIGGSVTLADIPEKTGYVAVWKKDNTEDTYDAGEIIQNVAENMSFTAIYSPIKVEEIEVTLAKDTLHIGESTKASATVTPSDALNKNVTWTSSDVKVATVDEKGVVTAVGEGDADIKATAKDGSGEFDEATVTVEGNPDDDSDFDDEDNDETNEAEAMKVTAKVKNASGVKIPSTYKLAPKKSMQLVVSFLPEDADEESLTFKSSNSKIVKVSSKGKITATKKTGKATITVESENGLKKTFKVQVMKKAVSKVKIKASKKTVKVKKTIRLKATLSPSKKYASTNVFWKSSNSKIATVTQKGVVKGVKKGNVKITAIATDGSGKKATIKIEVKK